MPIYEFACAKCGREFEEITSKDSVPCPHCGSHDTHKLMSACARCPGREGRDCGAPAASGGCGSCSGGNCASCGR